MSDRFVRHKETADKVLPPVKELIAGKNTVQWYVDLAGKDVKLEFGDMVDSDPWPIPMPIDREGYQSVEDSHFYWASGLHDWLNVKSAVNEFGLRVANRKLRLLDVGCATGRVIRHAYTLDHDSFEITGCDIGVENIQWLKRHFPPNIRTLVNTYLPHLPFPDGYFDVVTGFSLLPHLDYLEDAWILELARITQPSGLLYLTIANETTWLDSVDRAATIGFVERTNSVEGNETLSKQSFEQVFEGPRYHRWIDRSSVYNCYVWHKNDYVKSHWSQYINVERIVDRAHCKHHAVVLARPKLTS